MNDESPSFSNQPQAFSNQSQQCGSKNFCVIFAVTYTCNLKQLLYGWGFMETEQYLERHAKFTISMVFSHCYIHMGKSLHLLFAY
jgi:hypothetical protein